LKQWGTVMKKGVSVGYRAKVTGGVFAALTAACAPAMGQSVDKLEAELRQMQEQMRVLQGRVDEAKEAAAAAQWAAESKSAKSEKKGDDIDLKVKWKGAPELSSRDGKFKMKVRGRLNLDYNAINQDTAITTRPDVSSAEIRRARLGIEGLVWGDVGYRFEVDFANDRTAIKDAYLEYLGLMDGLTIRIGNFKTFNSLEHLESANYITFLERAAFIEAFTFDRQIGVGAIYEQKHYTASAGIFGPLSANDEVWLDDVKTGAARVTVAPINDDARVLHFGASWRSRYGADDLRANPIPINDEHFLYRARGADLHLADRFISTPAIFSQDTFWGLEAAFVWGPWSVQGEYGQATPDVAASFLGPNPTYNGWYIDASWFITGETRPYKEGVFGRPKVLAPVFEGGHGAWQIAARYDQLDLNDKAANIPTCTMCGNQNTWLIGVNWWLNDYTRLMFDYSESLITGGLADTANVNDGARIRGFGTRAQVDW